MTVDTARRRRRLGADAGGEHRHLLAGSAALVVGAAVQALTGAVFWLVAARVDDTEIVGQSTALFTSILFLAYLAGLGLPVALARYAPGRDTDSHVVFSWAVAANATWAAVLAVGYLAVVDTEATRALTAEAGALGPVLFVIAAVGSSVTLLVDVRWMTVRRWKLVLGRIAVVGLARFPLLLVPAGDAETVHLFAAATVPLLVSGVWGAVAMGRFTGGTHRFAPRPGAAVAAVRYAAVNYLSTLAYQAPQFVLPVIVLLEVDPDTNAAFYVAWGITAMGLYVPMAIGQALLAEGGKDGAELRKQVRAALVATTALMALAAVATAVARDIVTVVYGDDYAEAARVLPALVAGTVPWAVTSVLLTESRVLHRTAATVSVSLVLTVSILAPAVILVPNDGLDGATASFLVGNVIAAVVAVGFHLAGRRAHDAVPDRDAIDEDLALHP